MSFNVIRDDNQDNILSPAWKNIKVNKLNCAELELSNSSFFSGIGPNLVLFKGVNPNDTIVSTVISTYYQKIGNVVSVTVSEIAVGAGALSADDILGLSGLNFLPRFNTSFLSPYIQSFGGSNDQTCLINLEFNNSNIKLLAYRTTNPNNQFESSAAFVILPFTFTYTVL